MAQEERQVTTAGRAGEGGPKAEELNWLDAAELSFRWEGGSLPIRMTHGNRRSILSLCAARAFPHSDPLGFIQLYEGKAEGRGEMVGMLRELGVLKVKDRAIVEECLRRGYLVPRVLRVVEIKDIFHLVRWVLETDRGRCEFDLSDTHEQIELREGGKVIVTDTDGNRYEIPDWRKLDPESRARLDFYL